VKEQWWPTIHRVGPVLGVSLFALGLALLGLLTRFRYASSVGGFPIWALSIFVLVFVAYLWALIVKALILRRRAGRPLPHDDEASN
jgi:hypothetical protein